ncbi:MAG: DMT family transporter [Akkermansiaceae bacterium]|nr:DMT family transporter [Akkermansiaceae bacterium]
MNGQTQTRAHLITLAAFLCFGLMSPMCKWAMESGVVNGVSMAAFRLCGAAVLFWLISPMVPKQSIDKEDWKHLVIMSLCGMGINQFCYVIGVQHTSPTNACVITTSTPVFTFVLSALFLHTAVTLRKVGGLVLAATGALILILGSQLQGGKSGNVLGDAICLFSQLSATCYFVFFSGVIKKYHPVILMRWLFLISAVLTLPIWVHSVYNLNWSAWGKAEITGTVYTVLFGSFISYLLMIVGQRQLEPSTVAAYNYIQPIIAATVGIMLGVDELTWQKVAAAIFIAAGVCTIAKKE